MTALLRFVLGLVAAVLCWGAVARMTPTLVTVFDPFLVLVLYHGLRRRASGRPTSPLSGALAGSVAGLVHDALTGGWLGLHGFADALTAWLMLKVQQRMDLQQTVQIALAGLLASVFQQAALASLQFFLVSGGEMPELRDVLLRMMLTGLLLALVCVAAERFVAAEARWRERRRSKLRLDA